MKQRIEHMPIAFFSTVMGLSGLTLAMQKAVSQWAAAAQIASLLGLLTSLVFIALILLYGSKLVLHGTAVKQEFLHPVKLAFSATISISLILLSIIYLHTLPGLSYYLWVGGSLLHLLLTLYVLSSWIHHTHYDITHINPAWFIPVVGNILIPIAGVEHANVEISWFFYAIGIVFWLVLFAIIMYRIIFHSPMAVKLWPTLFILIAPPAAGFVAYVRLVGEVDSFARILFYIGLFITLLLLVQMPRFIRLPFFLSWWAYSFPIAVMTVASFVMYEKLGLMLFLYLADLLLIMLWLVIGLLVILTVKSIQQKKICIEE